MFLSVSHYDTRNFVNLRSSFSSRWDSESLRLFREKGSSPQRECERFRVDITAFVFFLFLRKKNSFPFLFFFSFPRCLNDERFFVASTRAASFCIVILSLVASLTRHFPAPPSSVVPAVGGAVGSGTRLIGRQPRRGRQRWWAPPPRPRPRPQLLQQQQQLRRRPPCCYCCCCCCRRA